MAEMEVGGITFDTDALEEMTLDQMVTVFNAISGRDPVGRFRDKATGLAALRDALAKREAQPAPEIDAETSTEPSTEATTEVTTEKEVAVETTAPAPAEPEPMPHGRAHRPLYEPDDLIFVMVRENPKRASSTSAARFAKYRDGMTVKEALAAGLKRDLAWDWDHGFITIHKPEGAQGG